MSFTLAKMQKAARDIDNANTGYDQSARWSFFNRSTRTIVPNRESDCSTVCGAIAALGGSGISLRDTFYTGTFRARALATGKFKAIKFTRLSQVRAGDFLLNEGMHVEFAYTNTTFFSANLDEKGGIAGGKAGDQTGREVYFKPAYVYYAGWDYIIRPIFDKAATKSTATLAKEVIAGSWGNGSERTTNLKKAGYDPAKVQAEVNKLLAGKPKATKSVATLAKEVLEGKWGNGDTRTSKLKRAGYNPAKVQAEVNKRLASKSTKPKAKSATTVAREVIQGVWGNGKTRVSRLKAAGYNPTVIQAAVNRLLR